MGQLGLNFAHPRQIAPSHSKNIMDKVFLVHGLWMSGYACLYWRHAVRQAGMQPTIYSYHTVLQHLDNNADRLFHAVQRDGLDAPRLHFVGHSMGGIVIMHMLRRHGHKIPNLGRVVLAASPIRGSYCAFKGASWPVVGKVVGYSILEWDGIVKDDYPPNLEVGTLVGSRQIGLGRIVGGLPQPSDGTVSVTETELDGATDRLVLHVNHSEMLFAPAAAQQIVHFLQHGQFWHRSSNHKISA